MSLEIIWKLKIGNWKFSASMFLVILVIIFLAGQAEDIYAQKVLQCSPLKATVNNDLEVKNDLQVDRNASVAGDLTVSGGAVVNGPATIKNNASVYNNLFIGSTGTNDPYIAANSATGLLFSSLGSPFLFKINGSDMMQLQSGYPLAPNNAFNAGLTVNGTARAYKFHSQGFYLDMQGGIGPVPRQNIFKITNTAATGNGAAVFLGDPSAYDNNSIIFSELTGAQDIGKIMMTMNTASGNVGVATVNPQITLAIGDNDTGLKWNADGYFSLMSNNTWELSIDPGNVRVRNNLCLGGVCASSWPVSPTITLTGDVTGSGTTNIATTIPSGTIAWGELSGIPAGFADNTDNGITSVPNCGANQKLTGSGGSPICANDLDTDNQTLSIAGSTLSISGGNNIALPAAAAEADTLDSVTGRGNTTVNSISTGGLTSTGNLSVLGNTTLGDARADATMINGRLDILGGDISFGEDQKKYDLYFRCTVDDGKIDTEWNDTGYCAWEIGSYPKWNPLGTFSCGGSGTLTTPTAAQVYDILVNQLGVKNASYEFSKILVDSVNSPQDAVNVDWCGGGGIDGTQGRILAQPWREVYFKL